MDYETFLLVQYFAQGLGLRFLDLNDTDRKDLFIRLTSSFDFQKIKDLIDLDVKTLNNKINDLNLKESSLTSRISAYKESQINVDSLIEDQSNIVISVDKAIISLSELEKIQKPDISKFVDLRSKTQNQLDKIFENKGASQFLRKRLKQIDSENEPEDTCDGVCPSCSQSIDIINGTFSLHDSESFKAKIHAWRVGKNSQKEDIVKNIKELEASIGKEEELRSIIDRCNDKINEQRESYAKTEARIDELRSFVKLKKKELDSIMLTIESQSAINENISKCQNILDKITEEKENILNYILVLQAASQIVSPTGVQAYVLDSIIETFNDKVNANLQVSWSDCRYELKSHKENKSGSVVAKMSDNLIINGSSVGLGFLSGGERKCLSLAIDLALLDTYMSFSSLDLSPIILDEPFDHLDSINRSRIFELLQEASKTKQIIVIDHSSEFKTLFDNIITINKRNEISTIA
jgi:DNA repair exonuclease SbcCD ATPase subunit